MAPQQTDAVSSDLQEPLLPVSNDEELLTATVTEATTTSEIEKNITLPACCCCVPETEEDEDDNDEENSESSPRSSEESPSTPRCFKHSTIQVNHNVFLNLLVAISYGISESLWNGTAYSAYLKKIGHDRNGPLGDIEAVSGLASLFAALPVGYLADRIGRSKVIAAGGILLGITTLLQISVLQWIGTDESNDDEETNSRKSTALWIMGGLMAFWGIGDGVVNGPCSALYADSTPEGERTTYYNYLFGAYTVSTMVGPLVSIALFQTLGDDWNLYDLRVVIYVGLGLELLNSILMLFFDDKKALDEVEIGAEAEIEAVNGGEEENNNIPEHETEPLVDDELVEEQPEQAGSDTEQQVGDDASSTAFQRRQQWIPYIVFLQGLIFALGSGMTVKFFPLFFKDEVGMSPSQVQVIYCLVPIVMVICSTLASYLASTGFGRVQTTLVFSSLGVMCLYLMVFFKFYLDRHPFLLVPIYVLRTSLMNSTYPLQESILMDFVPKDVRARWKSLDAVASFGWCGSAALGGWLSDKFDYTYTFLITAILQSVGIGVWSFLLPLVPRKEGERV